MPAVLRDYAPQAPRHIVIAPAKKRKAESISEEVPNLQTASEAGVQSVGIAPLSVAGNQDEILPDIIAVADLPEDEEAVCEPEVGAIEDLQADPQPALPHRGDTPAPLAAPASEEALPRVNVKVVIRHKSGKEEAYILKDKKYWIACTKRRSKHYVEAIKAMAEELNANPNKSKEQLRQELDAWLEQRS